MNNISILQMQESDFEDIKKNLLEDFDDFWNANTLKSELNKENTFVFVAKKDFTIVGFISLFKILDEMDLMNIVVHKKYRRQNIGKSLLSFAIDFAKNQNCKCITLEVNEENLPAKKLYTKLGFILKGQRKNYYGLNQNADIMTITLKK